MGYLPAIKNAASTDEKYINRMKRGEREGVLMAETFPRRRHELIGGRAKRSMTVAKLKGTYPALFEKEEFWREFERVVATRSLDACLDRMTTWLRRVQAACFSTKDDAPMSLVRILGEEVAVISDADERADVCHPFLRLDDSGTHELLVEQPVVLQGIPGLDLGLILWAASHFVLNQKTANTVKNVLWFVLHHIIQVDHEKPPSAAAEEEINRLKSYTSSVA